MAWDYFNVTTAETQTAIDATTERIKTLSTEYANLSALDPDALSTAEKERLTYLDERIAKEEELLKLQNAKKATEEIGGKFTDLFDEGSYSNKLLDEFLFGSTIELLTGGSSENVGILSANTLREIQYYKGLKDSISQFETLPADSPDYELMHAHISAKKQELEDYNFSNMQEQYATWSEKAIQYEDAIAQLEADAENPYISENARNEANSKIEEYKQYLSSANIAIDELSKILFSPEQMLKSLDTRLENFDAESLKSTFTENELKILMHTSIDKDASLEDLQSIINEQQAIADNSPVIITTLEDALNYQKTDPEGNVTSDSLNTKISTYRQDSNTLNNYLQKISDGTFTSDDALDLAQNYGIVGNSIDETASKIKELEEQNLSSILADITEMVDTTADEGTKEKLNALAAELENISTENFDIPAPVSISDSLDTFERSLTALNAAKTDLASGNSITQDTLDAIEKSFRGFEDVDTSAINHALEELKNASSLNDAQNAVSALTDEYLNCSGILKQVDENNNLLIASRLEEMGVTNAQAFARFTSFNIS